LWVCYYTVFYIVFCEVVAYCLDYFVHVVGVGGVLVG
jgi:hypothetical protein